MKGDWSEKVSMGRSGCRGVGLLLLWAQVFNMMCDQDVQFFSEFVPLTSLSRGDIIFSALDFFLSSSGRIAPLLRGGEMNEV